MIHVSIIVHYESDLSLSLSFSLSYYTVGVLVPIFIVAVIIVGVLLLICCRRGRRPKCSVNVGRARRDGSDGLCTTIPKGGYILYTRHILVPVLALLTFHFISKCQYMYMFYMLITSLH